MLQLSVDKSAGPEGLHPVILKNCVESKAKPISLIFSKSFETGDLTAEDGTHCS